jgi:hypothetical protein
MLGPRGRDRQASVEIDPIGCVWHTRAMKTQTLLMIVTAVFACLGARAEDAPAPATAVKAPDTTATPPGTSPAAPAAAAAANTSDPATKPADQAPAGEPEVSKEQDKRLRGMGYRQSTRNGKMVYCRQEAVLGSRFTRMVCGTAADLERVAQGAREQTEHMQRSGLNQISRE